MNEKLTHFDEAGQAHMVDVGAKAETARRAVAEGVIRMRPETLAVVASGTAKKGDVLGVAQVAAIQGAKKTSDLIPLCHPIAMTRVAVEFEIDTQTNAVADISSGQVLDARTLMSLQAEVVRYTVLVDVSSKLAGKSTQALDALMKGQ